MQCMWCPCCTDLSSSPEMMRSRRSTKKMWRGLWGSARVASNKHLAAAVAIKSHTILAEGRKFMDACRNIWDLASSEQTKTRPLLNQLWQARSQPRRQGLWATFLRCLVKARMRLIAGGGILDEATNQLHMHISQQRAAWMHQARLMWRKVNIMRANKTLPGILPEQITMIDWTCTSLQSKQRSPWLDTAQTNGVNTKVQECKTPLGRL